MKTFTDRMKEKIREKRSILNVGFDPQLRFMPPHLIRWALDNWGTCGSRDRPMLSWEGIANLYLRFNQELIPAVAPYCVSIKPQSAFYEMYGHWGVWCFEKTLECARENGLLIIDDAKRGDGGETAEAYADGYIGEVPVPVLENGEIKFERVRSPVRVDAITIQPWIGTSCLNYFLKNIKEFGTMAFVVDKTSFTPNSEIEQILTGSGLPNWQVLAQMIQEWGAGTEGIEGYRNFGVVMGATYPDDAQIMRKILPNAWMLIPGYGDQGGGSDGAVVGFTREGLGGIVNSSRGVIAAWLKGRFKSDPENYVQAGALSAKFSRDDLNGALDRAGKRYWQ